MRLPTRYSLALSALAALGLVAATHAIAGTARHNAFDTIPAAKIARFASSHDVLRVPFDSALTLIDRCLTRNVRYGAQCAGAVGLTQRCETSATQCARATEDAWELYIEHYSEAIGKIATAREGLAKSQHTWAAYREAECAFEQDQVMSEGVEIAHITADGCLAGKTAERAIELRNALIMISAE